MAKVNKKNLFSKALQYAVGGYSVIPLGKDKRPSIASWLDFQQHPADESIIEAWWKKNPDANIGIITGKISGITVVDIDTHDKKNTVDYKKFPPTFTVKTPSGGMHLYYAYDADIKQTANTYPQFPHLDIRNDGGYVVAAPSITDYSDKGVKKGGLYEIVDGRAPVAFPRKLFLGKDEAKKAKAGEKKLSAKLGRLHNMKPGEGRNVALASLIGTLIRNRPESEYTEIEGAFMDIVAGMKYPLEEGEAQTTWNSIAKKAGKTALKVPLICNEKGNPYLNLENVKTILEKDERFMGRIVYDEFYQAYLYKKMGGDSFRELHETDEITLTREISVAYPPFAMIHPTMVHAAIMEYARENKVDAQKDYVESLEWDKTPRLDMWLTEVYGVPQNEYHRTVGSNVLKGMVSRAVRPGCKFDYVLVLEGPQGTKKSTSLAVLGGDWHVETTATPDNKDFLMLLQGNWIIEFSEGETLSRGEIKQLKALITTQFDKFRAPYERYVANHPRRCIFAMTTNQTEYLKDETGNRRWLPVRCEQEANIEWLRTNRDQLLAEAHYRVVELNETTWEFPAEVLDEQYARQVEDPNTDRIVEWYETVCTEDNKLQGVTAHMAFISALMMGGRFTKKDQMDIAAIFKNVLKLEKSRGMVGGQRVTRWYRPEDLPVDGKIKVVKSQEEMANEF